MGNLSTFTSQSTDRNISLNFYATRPIVRISGLVFIFLGLYTLLYWLPSQGVTIDQGNIAPIKIMSLAGIIAGIGTFYRKCTILDKDHDMLSITRDILFRLTRKDIPLSKYDSLYMTYETSNESPVVPGEVNPSAYSLYIYQLYLHGPNDEQLLAELQESSAPFNQEPHYSMIKLDELAQEISALTGKSLNYSQKMQDSLDRIT